MVVEALINFARDPALQRHGGSSLVGLVHWKRPKFLRSLADAGLAGLILARVQQLVGNGIVHESDEGYGLIGVCRVVGFFFYPYWAPLSDVRRLFARSRAHVGHRPTRRCPALTRTRPSHTATHVICPLVLRCRLARRSANWRSAPPFKARLKQVVEF